MSEFRTELGEKIFHARFAQGKYDTWTDLSKRVWDSVCNPADIGHPLISADHLAEGKQVTRQQQFIPGGRYLYYAGRKAKYFNNCALLAGLEDTREEWARLMHDSMLCLSTGAGIGTDYSIFRPEGSPLSRTGGIASGPLPLIHAVNETGRSIEQGGARRSAMYASLRWSHGDAGKFLVSKDWQNMPAGSTGLTIADLKNQSWDYPAPLDMTNISLNYDTEWCLTPDREKHPIFVKNVRQALMTGEPGFSFNFFEHEKETLRNACTEVTSEFDGDICNLGSVNMAACNTLDEFIRAVRCGARFLVCGTITADVPYEKIAQVRAQTRRIGLGLMGIHEWLLVRGYRYECVGELHKWLEAYQFHSKDAADRLCDRLNINRPIAYRAIAPTGTIGMMAGTTTAIEPVYAVAYARSVIVGHGGKRVTEYVVDGTAQRVIDETGIDPDLIESSLSLAADPERRIKFQADVQDYVDMAISSTINLPPWGSDLNNEDKVEGFAALLGHYATRLRGFTCYPDGSRGGQPLVSMPYKEVMAKRNHKEDEVDICVITGKGGTCGA